MPLKIGLTGGIASGKSLAAECFADLGVPVIDADLISRELVAPGTPLLEQIRQRFGDDFVDQRGELDRRRLREHIFDNPRARRELERILHPAIRDEMERRAEESEAPYVVLVIPLLLESGQRDLVDRVLVIDVPREMQLERLRRRDAAGIEQARKILGAQAGREQRLAMADDVISNTGSPASLCRAVEALHRKYLELAGQRSD